MSAGIEAAFDGRPGRDRGAPGPRRDPGWPGGTERSLGPGAASMSAPLARRLGPAGLSAAAALAGFRARGLLREPHPHPWRAPWSRGYGWSRSGPGRGARHLAGTRRPTPAHQLRGRAVGPPGHHRVLPAHPVDGRVPRPPSARQPRGLGDDGSRTGARSRAAVRVDGPGGARRAASGTRCDDGRRLAGVQRLRTRGHRLTDGGPGAVPGRTPVFATLGSHAARAARGDGTPDRGLSARPLAHLVPVLPGLLEEALVGPAVAGAARSPGSRASSHRCSSRRGRSSTVPGCRRDAPSSDPMGRPGRNPDRPDGAPLLVGRYLLRRATGWGRSS